MKGFLLSILAIILLIIVFPFGFLYQCILEPFSLNRYFTKIAISIDQFGNVSCAKLLTFSLVKRNGYPMGNIDESLSSVLGKNKASGTLTFLGQWLANLLDSLEPNHVENAIEEVNPKEN